MLYYNIFMTHSHDHGHHHHAHSHAHHVAVPFSLLCAGILSRLAIAAAAMAVMWLVCVWALWS